MWTRYIEKCKEAKRVRYKGEEALGLVETIGLVPALKACDEMLKGSKCGTDFL